MIYKTINENNLSNMKKLNLPLHEESEIYVLDNSLYKIYYPYFRTSQRKETVDKLNTLDNSNCVIPLYGINNQKNEFCGIVMNYLKDYYTLSYYLKHYSIKLEDRKKIVKLLAEILQYLDSMGICYYDIHSENFMINKDDLKVIDLDSSYMYKNLDNKTIKAVMRANNNLLFELCFGVLYNYDFRHLKIRSSDLMNVINKANSKQIIFLNKAFFKDNLDQIYDVRDFLQYFDEYFIF